MQRLLIILTFFFLYGAQSLAQTSPCGQLEIFTKLDFWVGEWKVLNPDGSEAGHNKITKVLDGCTILEEWTGAGVSRGKSLNFYNPQKKVWQQVWIDNFSNPLYFDGETRPDSMIYRGTSVTGNGTKVINEMTLSKVSENQVRQLWRQSYDEGKTWNTAFDGQYHRVKTE